MPTPTREQRRRPLSAPPLRQTGTSAVGQLTWPPWPPQRRDRGGTHRAGPPLMYRRLTTTSSRSGHLWRPAPPQRPGRPPIRPPPLRRAGPSPRPPPASPSRGSPRWRTTCPPQLPPTTSVARPAVQRNVARAMPVPPPPPPPPSRPAGPPPPRRPPWRRRRRHRRPNDPDGDGSRDEEAITFTQTREGFSSRGAGHCAVYRSVERSQQLKARSRKHPGLAKRQNSTHTTKDESDTSIF